VCRSPIETSPASPIEMSRSSVCLRLVEVAWDDGDHDELQRGDTPPGAGSREVDCGGVVDEMQSRSGFFVGEASDLIKCF
jgi:hypothetical protein